MQPPLSTVVGVPGVPASVGPAEDAGAGAGDGPAPGAAETDAADEGHAAVRLRTAPGARGRCR